MRRNIGIYATDSQITFIKRLNVEAFSKLYRGSEVVYISDWNRLLKSEASRIIEKLKAAQSRGWKS
jgi:hypothetical protein